MATIEELLHRRTDLSTFVVHFTRDTGTSARDNLLSILLNRCIEARNVHGMAKELAARFDQVAATQQAVCFTETPLEHAWMMCSPIEGREVQLGPHGVAFTKSFARRKSVNPVWFLDIDPRQNRQWLTRPINRLIQEAVEATTATATPVPGTDGPNQRWPQSQEFWWEREWRRVGDLHFTAQDIVVVFAPEHDHQVIRQLSRRAPRLPKQNASGR